jgi:glycine cleavage system H protein
MSDFLEFTIDKFTFRVATDRLYSTEGVWVKPEGGNLRIGLSDFLQQRSGDIAFAEIKPAGTKLVFGEEIGVIETIKVNISLGSPVSGTVMEVNPEMEATPEAINLDPYEKGWVAVLDPSELDRDRLRLLDAQAYFTQIKAEAENEVKKI